MKVKRLVRGSAKRVAEAEAGAEAEPAEEAADLGAVLVPVQAQNKRARKVKARQDDAADEDAADVEASEFGSASTIARLLNLPRPPTSMPPRPSNREPAAGEGAGVGGGRNSGEVGGGGGGGGVPLKRAHKTVTLPTADSGFPFASRTQVVDLTGDDPLPNHADLLAAAVRDRLSRMRGNIEVIARETSKQGAAAAAASAPVKVGSPEWNKLGILSGMVQSNPVGRKTYDQIVAYFNSKREQLLDTVVLTGKRGQRVLKQNFCISSSEMGYKLSSCVEELAKTLARSHSYLFTSADGSAKVRLIDLSLIDCQVSVASISPLLNSAPLDFLKRLDLSYNPIGSEGASALATALLDNSTLRTLRLVDTRLADIHVSRMRVQGKVRLEGFRDLMYALCINETIESLDVSFNYLGGTASSTTPFPRSYGYNSCEAHDDYGADSIKVIAAMLTTNTSLREINILSNGFDDSFTSAHELLGALRAHPSCTSLCGSLSHRVTNWRASLVSTGTTLSRLRPLPSLDSPAMPPPLPHTLSFRNTCLQPFAGRLLGAERCLLRSVVVLDLTDNCRLGEGIIFLCDELRKGSKGSASPSLRELVLRKVGATSACMTSIVSLLLVLPLSRLDLSDNPNIGDGGIALLSAGLAKCKSLLSLQLRFVGMTALGAGSVASALRSNTVLTTLDLSQNAVGCQGVANLQVALMCNKALTALTMCDADIQSKGATLIATLLPSCSLKTLDISSNVMCGKRSDNTFDPKPVITIGDSLHTKQCSLTSLNLSRSDIGARSTRRLMSALAFNFTVHTLIIDSCNISEEGAGHVGEALPDLLHLRNLHISACGVGPIGCQRIFLGLAHNTSITSLDMSCNQLTGYHYGDNANVIDFEPAAITAIASGLKGNTKLRYLNLANNRLFGLSQDRHAGSEGSFRPKAVTDLAEGIRQNALGGGKLQVLNLAENRFSSTPDTQCVKCVGRFISEARRLREKVQLNEAEVERRLLANDSCMWSEETCFHEKDPSKKDDADNKTTPCFEGAKVVSDLIDAFRSHKHLTSLLGITPQTSHVELSSLRCCDQYMRILGEELRRSHTIQSIDVDNNSISPRGLFILLSAVKENLSLRSLKLPIADLEAKPWTDIDKGDKNFLSHTSHTLERAQLLSYKSRVGLAVFVHGFSHFGAAPCRNIIEFAIGKGPLVERFLRRRFVLTKWSEESTVAKAGTSPRKRVTGGADRDSLESPVPIVNEDSDLNPRRLVL